VACHGIINCLPPRLPGFPWWNIPKWTKYSKRHQHLRNGNNISKITTKWTEWPLNAPEFSFARPSKIYPTLDFWYAKTPSGNPGRYFPLSKELLIDPHQNNHVAIISRQRKNSTWQCKLEIRLQTWQNFTFCQEPILRLLNLQRCSRLERFRYIGEK
jgi:hypothetical protein